ncbi:RAP domain-containing protein, partial [Cardiosporidium cionae]
VGLYPRCSSFLGPFSVDLLFHSKNIVEIEGPSRFYRNSTLLTASTLLKQNILKAMGWQVFHIPYQEWEQCASKSMKLLYCASFWKRMFGSEISYDTFTLIKLIEENFEYLLKKNEASNISLPAVRTPLQQIEG